MIGEIFKETTRRAFRSALLSAAGIAGFGFYVVLLLPDPAGLQGYVQLMEAMPPALIQGIGLEDPSVMATAEGFLGFTFFTFGAVILSIFAILGGLDLTANDEELGAMNALLTLPVPRHRVVIERAASVALRLTIIALGAWAGLMAARAVNPAAAEIDAVRLLGACLSFIPLMLAVTGLTAVLATLFRRRIAAGALAGAFVAASYMLDTLGSVAGDGLGELMQRLSLYHYFDGAYLTLNGFDVGTSAAMLVIAGVLAAVTIYLFDRRDITV